jgi:hypothetical protein
MARHFNWMAQHGVDGVFLQRFAGQCDLKGGNEGIRNQRDEARDPQSTKYASLINSGII